MRIGLITTLDTNIGDDFIREGLVRVMRRVFAGRELEFVPVNKHEPWTVYPRRHPVFAVNRVNRLPVGRRQAKRLIRYVGVRIGFTRFDRCDLIVQCGAPVFWPTCGTTTLWRDELWYEVIGRIHKRIPVLNLAAGSCYPWERQPDRIDNSADADYIQRLNSYCRRTTVRDELAQKLLASIGIDVPLIACSACLAAPPVDALSAAADGPVLVNYMTGGGHYDWDQHIDVAAWQAVARELIGRLASRHPVALLCHDQKEFDLAGELAPGLRRVWPKSPAEYFAAVAGAKAGIFNRMHANVGLAGMGIPSIAVCTDSRMRMVERFGLPCHYVKDANVQQLEDEAEDLIRRRCEERDRLLALRKQTEDAYADVLSRFG